MYISEANGFVIRCMEAYSTAKKKSGVEVLALFKKYDVIGYLQRFYGILQTVDWDYLEYDIDEYLRCRTVKPRSD